MPAEYMKLSMTAANALACLNGTKTMTRRVMKPQPWMFHKGGNTDHEWLGPYEAEGGVWRRQWRDEGGYEHVDQTQGPWKPRYAPGQKFYIGEPVYKGGVANIACYKADAVVVPWDRGWKWKVKTLAGRYMPRDCARMVGVIGDVRAEWVQDISEDDATAEGAWAWFKGIADQAEFNRVVKRLHDLTLQHFPDEADERGWNPCRRAMFAFIWESIHGIGAWAKNPWVWVYTFTIIARGAEAQELLRKAV